MLQFYSHYATMLELEKRELEKRSKYRELLRDAEQSQSKNRFGRKMAHQFGTQMVSWGTKLQNINTASPADIATNTKLSR